MKSMSKVALPWFIVLAMTGVVNAQQMSAVGTAELGVNTLLETVAESKDLFLSDRDRYFANVEAVLNTASTLAK